MEEIESLAEVYKVFSDPTRLKIIKLLSDHRFLCVNAITSKLNVTQSAVSQHLRILRQIGMVTSERRAFHIHYTLNKDMLKSYRQQVKKILGSDFIMNK